MYSVLSYGAMAMDAVRTDAYARAIEAVVRPGSVVVDLGAGTGILSLLAARAGARRVIAVEPNPAVQLLPELARANGCGDVIEIHQASSFDVAFGEKADVVVSDLRGSWPLHDEHLAILADARTRILAPDGILLPATDELFVAGIESPAMWRFLERGWLPFERRGLDGSAARRSVLNDAYNDANDPLLASDVVTTSGSWCTIVYGEKRAPAVTGSASLRATRGGVCHGLACWFRATLTDSIAYDNAPGSRLAYSRVFLPFEEPLALRAGDGLDVTLRTSVRGEQWAWETTAKEKRTRQSTFLGNPVAAADLVKLAGSHEPRRNARGERLFQILGAMDGETSVDAITQRFAPTLADEVVAEVRAAVRDYAT